MRNNSSPKSNNLFKAIILGNFFGIIIMIALLLLFSYLLSKSLSIPHNIVTPVVLFVTATGSLIGGYVTGRIVKIKNIIPGIICGISMFLIILIAGFIAVRESLTFVTLIRFLVIIFFTTIGNIIGLVKS